MINLKNDYNAIAHKKVLEALVAHQDVSYSGYGTDEETAAAKLKISEYFNVKNAAIELLIGGTSTNKIFIAHALKPYEAVIACDSGHINVHETGAIEETGHKVLTVRAVNGKMKPESVRELCLKHQDEHMVRPKMLYISNSTELGSVYTLNEIKALSEVAEEFNLYFYMDGARLGTALASSKCDYKPSELAKYFDAFYVGGTKNGGILGEALVINNPTLQTNIRYSVKHYGGMLAKGFLNGLSFKTLFTDNLFFEIASLENKLAKDLTLGLTKLGYKFLIETETNQVFVIVSKKTLKTLEKELLFEVWESYEDKVVIRLVTNFLTTAEIIKETLEIFKNA